MALRQHCWPRRCGKAGPYLLGSLEAEADVLVVAGELLLAALAQQHPLLVLEDRRLLLVGPLGLRGDRRASRRALGAEPPPGPRWTPTPAPGPGSWLVAGAPPCTPGPPARSQASCRLRSHSPAPAGPTHAGWQPPARRRPGAGRVQAVPRPRARPVAARSHLRVRHLAPRGGKEPAAPRGAAYPAGRGERRKWRHRLGRGSAARGPPWWLGCLRKHSESILA